MLNHLIRRFWSSETGTYMDLGIENGSIAYLAQTSESSPPALETTEANGRCLLPGFVEPHIHLDKAWLLDSTQEKAGSLADAIRLTANLKRTFTPEDVYRRSVKVIERSVRAGVTHMRVHAEIDPIVNLSSFEGMLRLKREFEEFIDLQIIAFPQEGIFQSAGTAEMMREAMDMGADGVGGIPYNDRDPEEHLEFVFGLAQKFAKPLDLHLDFSDDPTQLHILSVIEKTHQYGLQGRVTVGHLTSLGSVEATRAREIATLIGAAGISVVALPMTDLYLGGRLDQERVRRGLTPVNILHEQGVNVIFGSNNIRNLFTPFGTADPLDIALLLAQVSHMGSLEDVERLIHMLTYGAAAALNLTDYGMKLGAPANLVLCDAENLRDLLLDRSDRAKVWKRGKVVAETARTSVIHRT